MVWGSGIGWSGLERAGAGYSRLERARAGWSELEQARTQIAERPLGKKKNPTLTHSSGAPPRATPDKPPLAAVMLLVFNFGVEI